MASLSGLYLWRFLTPTDPCALWSAFPNRPFRVPPSAVQRGLIPFDSRDSEGGPEPSPYGPILANTLRELVLVVFAALQRFE